VTPGYRGPASAVLLAAALVMSLPQAALAQERDQFESANDLFQSGVRGGTTPLGQGYEGVGLKSVIPKGGHTGANAHWYFSDHGYQAPEELYWRYWVRFPKGFHIEPPSRGKLPGPAGLYHSRCLGNRPSTASEPCFSARMMFTRTYPRPGDPDYPFGPSDQTLVGFYTYHLDSPRNRGDIWPWDRDVATLDHGKWYCLEGRISLNTPGEHDGVLEGWVDGELAFSKDDIAFRRSHEDWVNVRSFWFNVYYGGKSPTTVRNEIHFDSLALGAEKVGCQVSFTGAFLDDDGSVFEPHIEWLVGRRVTTGCNPPDNTRFCPNDSLTRAAAAAFLVRALALDAASESGHFKDTLGSAFARDIDALAEAGITAGCNPPDNDMFCPEGTLTRAELATMLSRAAGLDPADGDHFDDIEASPHRETMNRVAAAGISQGCGERRFCPDTPVTRGAAAALIHRTFMHLEEKAAQREAARRAAVAASLSGPCLPHDSEVVCADFRVR
jgi:hypothetical protein